MNAEGGKEFFFNIAKIILCQMNERYSGSPASR